MNNNEKFNDPSGKSWQANLVESLREDRAKEMAKLGLQLKELNKLGLKPKTNIKLPKKDKRTKIERLMDQFNEAIDLVREENNTSWSAGYQTEWNRGAQAGASMVSVKLQEIIKRDLKIYGK